MAQELCLLTFQDPSGVPLAFGKVTFDLSFDIASPSVQIAARRQVSVDLNSEGSCSVLLWANDTDSSGSIYFVRAYSAQGQPAWSGQITVPVSSQDVLLLEDGTPLLLEDGTYILLE